MIAERCVPDCVEVIASNGTGKWQLHWSSPWLPGQLRTCKTLSAIISPIVYRRICAVIESHKGREWLPHNIERPSLNPRFPRVVLQYAKKLHVSPREYVGLSCDPIGIMSFQNLKKVILNLGQLSETIAKCVTWIRTWHLHFEHFESYFSDKLVHVVVKILTAAEASALRGLLLVHGPHLSVTQHELARHLAMVLADKDRCVGAVDKITEAMTDIHRHQLLGLPNDAVVEIQCQYNDGNDQVSCECTHVVRIVTNVHSCETLKSYRLLEQMAKRYEL